MVQSLTEQEAVGDFLESVQQQGEVRGQMKRDPSREGEFWEVLRGRAIAGMADGKSLVAGPLIKSLSWGK